MINNGLYFTLNVKDLPRETFSVVGFTLQEQYSALFSLELELASAIPAVDFGKVLDKDITLMVWRDAVMQRAVNGIVVSMEQGDTGFRRTRYSLSVRPALWRASLRRNSRIFQQQNLQTIVETLLGEHGISDYAYSLRYEHAVREFCVQYQEDDLTFIERMFAEEGIFYFFEHDGDRHTLVFADHCDTQNVGPVLPYNPAPAQEPCITTLRRRESLRPSEVMLKDYTFKNPPWDAVFREYARDMEYQSQRYFHYDYPGRYKDDSGERFSRWRVEALRNNAHQGDGSSNYAGLQPGTDFTLTHHPRPDMNTRWQITSITHRGNQPQALEEEAGETGTTLVNQFNFIPRNQTWRPLLTDKPRIDGAQIAIVTGPPGEEIYCDAYGRIRVRFLWDRSGKIDDSSSCWIRVSQPWAGKGWGSLAIPRIGHEVIVEFLNGDPDQPVVIGRTYHVNNLPPGGLPGTKTQMSLRSQTHKGAGFNELRFEDEKGKQEVFIHAQKDMNTKILHDRTMTVANNDAETIGGFQSITVDKDQTLTIKENKIDNIKGNETIFIGGNEVVTVDGSYTLTVKSDSCKIIRGGANMELMNESINLKVGAASIAMKASGEIDIRGATITINGSGIVDIDGSEVQIN
ncbi:type VI secretion system tip protein TssI/VgrG [Pseudescherichia vulneris]